MAQSQQLRIALDEAQLRRLVAGQVVIFKTGDQQRIEVQCILSDIGWSKILQAVFDGMGSKGPPDPPEAREFLPNRYTRRPQ